MWKYNFYSLFRNVLCKGGCVCANFMQRTNACAEFVQNEESAEFVQNEERVEGSFVCNVFSNLWEGCIICSQ